MAIYTISMLTKEIYSILRISYPQLISVEGEVSNFKASTNGHWYFTLKDEKSQVQAVMFKTDNRNYALPKNGDKIEVTANVSFYQTRGDCQLVCQTITPRGFGALLVMLEERKKKYAVAGYFDIDKKKSFPKLAQRIGIITSSKAAALQDIVRIFTQKTVPIHVYIFSSLVQGEGAGKDIANNIKIANDFFVDSMKLDILIVTRGGGSTEDLLAFSDEVVIQSIADSKIPIISAVGHETDSPISDFVADIAVPTPTAAATLVTEQIVKNKEYVQYIHEFIMNMSTQKIEQLKKQIIQCDPRSLMNSIQERTNHIRQKIDNITEMISQKTMYKFYDTKNKYLLFKETIDASSPQTILKRGFALIYESDTQKIIKDSTRLISGKEIIITLQNGSKHATIK